MSLGSRTSCFQTATKFKIMVTIAAPWITWIKRIALKSDNNQPRMSELINIPTNNMTYKRATTRGRVSSVAKSVARARPAVCVVCIPKPTRRKATAAATSPTIGGATPSPDKIKRANGRIAKPPNCAIVPIKT